MQSLLCQNTFSLAPVVTFYVYTARHMCNAAYSLILFSTPQEMNQVQKAMKLLPIYIISSCLMAKEECRGTWRNWMQICWRGNAAVTGSWTHHRWTAQSMVGVCHDLQACCAYLQVLTNAHLHHQFTSHLTLFWPL